MKIYKEVNTVTRQLQDTLCDICKHSIKNHTYDTNEVAYITDKLEINYELTQSTYEYGSSQRLDLELCGECARTKLFPFLESCGAEIKVVESDW